MITKFAQNFLVYSICGIQPGKLFAQAHLADYLLRLIPETLLLAVVVSHLGC
jgi:hypothetical protein